MLPHYSTFKIYHRLTNLFATIGDTTKLPIELIGTSVYTLNGRTILTCNALHIPALRTHSASTAKDQGMVSTHHTKMAHISFSKTSSYK